MGRYAFFNTGFEYKFVFAVQPSEDILKFGGTPTFVYEGNHTHNWTIIDRKLIENKIRDLEEALELNPMNFEPYKKSSEGTGDLRYDLWKMNVKNEELFATYTLGCILYHQLLYKLDLSCSYES